MISIASPSDEALLDFRTRLVRDHSEVQEDGSFTLVRPASPNPNAMALLLISARWLGEQGVLTEDLVDGNPYAPPRFRWVTP